MTADTPGARLVCRSGALAGTKLRLGRETHLGEDAGGEVAVASRPEELARPQGRILYRDGAFHLEAAGSGGLRLDGMPLEGPTRLGRLHVIGLPGGVELVFSADRGGVGDRARAGTAGEAPGPREVAVPDPGKRGAAGSGTAPAGREGEALPATPQPPDPGAHRPPRARPGQTRVDLQGFGALPDLPPRDREPRAAPSGQGQDPGGDRERTPPADGATVVDVAGFDALPRLDRGGSSASGGESPAGRGREDRPAGAPAESGGHEARRRRHHGGTAGRPGAAGAPGGGDPPAAGDPAADGGPPSAAGPSAAGDPPGPADRHPTPSARRRPAPGHTVVDLAGFAALPDLRRGEGEGEGDAGGGSRQDPPSARTRPPPGPAPSGRPPPPPPPPRPASTGPLGALPAHEDATRAVPRVELELLVDLPGLGEKSFPLAPGDNVVGRGEACDVTVPDPELWLSRRHALVRVELGAVELVDLGSVNGTFVAGERIQRRRLEPGDAFVLGPHFEFRIRRR